MSAVTPRGRTCARGLLAMRKEQALRVLPRRSRDVLHALTTDAGDDLCHLSASTQTQTHEAQYTLIVTAAWSCILAAPNMARLVAALDRLPHLEALALV